jgi:hypothetical protein
MHLDAQFVLLLFGAFLTGLGIGFTVFRRFSIWLRIGLVLGLLAGGISVSWTYFQAIYADDLAGKAGADVLVCVRSWFLVVILTTLAAVYWEFFRLRSEPHKPTKAQ